MKSILIFVVIFLWTSVEASVYYVQDKAYNEKASDMNLGTDINQPWATWQKAFNTAWAGDTVYFRGGTWYPTSDNYGNVTIHYPANGNGYNGTYANPVCFFAYPPDVEQGNIPVLDCRNTHPSTRNHVGLYISDSRYVKFKGLKITNVRSWPRESGEMWCAGIMADDFAHLSLEQMTTSYIGGAGFFIMGNDTLYLTNCDSHHNCDSLDAELPGNDADGFTLLDDGPETDTFSIAYVHGCRAWNNSDDGFEISNSNQLDVRSCWSWNNGYLEGDPNGFKLNYSHLKTTWKRKVYNCIAAYNKRSGFTDLNLHSHLGPFMEYLNNTSYQCGTGYASGKGEVFDCTQHPASVIYRNNISYAYSDPYPAAFKACDYGYPTYVIQDHNTWIQTGENFYTETNPAYSASASDFLSLDTAQLRWPRLPDGSLPEITFLQLNGTSDLVNGGRDVGLAFYGPAPDLGAFQQGPFSVELISPEQCKKFKKGDPIRLKATVEGTPEDIEEVIFYSEGGERMLGQGNKISPSEWEFTWECDEVGYQDLRAVAFNSQSETATSSIVKVKVSWPLNESRSIADGNKLCKIIPNPNDGYFSLHLQEPLKEDSTIQIISMMGQVVAMERMTQDEISKEMDLSSLPPGVYNIFLGNGSYAPPCNAGIKIVLN